MIKYFPKYTSKKQIITQIRKESISPTCHYYVKSRCNPYPLGRVTSLKESFIPLSGQLTYWETNSTRGLIQYLNYLFAPENNITKGSAGTMLISDKESLFVLRNTRLFVFCSFCDIYLLLFQVLFHFERASDLPQTISSAFGFYFLSPIISLRTTMSSLLPSLS